MRIVGGAGPGHPDYFTGRLLDKIKTMDKVLAFRRIARTIRPLRGDLIVIDRVDDAVSYMKDYQDVLLLASGDPNFFGIVELIKKKGIGLDEVIPGISSLQYLASRLKKSYSRIITESVHGREFDFGEIDPNRSYSFLIDRKNNANYLSRELFQRGYRGRLYCGYNLSYEDEEILVAQIGEEIMETSELGIVVVEFYVD